MENRKYKKKDVLTLGKYMRCHTVKVVLTTYFLRSIHGMIRNVNFYLRWGNVADVEPHLDNFIKLFKMPLCVL